MTGFEAAALSMIARQAKKYTEKWAKADAKDLGEWRGSAAYLKTSTRRERLLGLPVGSTDYYDVTLSLQDPQRFYSYVTKHEYRTAPILTCDLGSIHPVLRPFGGALLDLDPSDYKKSYHMHDGVYDEGGVWVRDPANPKSEWVFVPCERVFGDILLMWGMTAEGANNATLQAVYRTVRAAASTPWKKHRERDIDSTLSTS